MSQYTPLWVKNLKIGVIGFALVAIAVVWNLWLHNSDPTCMITKLAGGVCDTGNAYPTIPWIVVSIVAGLTVLIMFGKSLDQEYRKMLAKRARAQHEQSIRC